MLGTVSIGCRSVAGVHDQRNSEGSAVKTWEEGGVNRVEDYNFCT